MKRLLAFLLTLILTISILSACGKSEPADADGDGTASSADNAASNSDIFYGEDDITLTLWVPESLVTLTEQLCDDFINQYPDTHITINVSAQDESDAAATLIDNPDAADVFSFPCDQTAKLKRNKLLSPVADDYLDDVRSRNFLFSIDAATLDDELIAYPQTGENGYYLIYDKSVVSDEDAKSLEGVLQACRQAKKKFVMDADTGFYACMFLFTGGLYTNGLTENDKQIFSEYNEDTVVDSLQAFAELLHQYKDVFKSADTKTLCKGLEESNSQFAAGIDGSWDADSVTKALGSNYGAAKLPTINIRGTDTQIFSINGAKLIGVNARCQYPHAAQALANYLTDEACQKARLEAYNWLPSNTELLQSDTVRNSPTLSALAKQAEYSIPMINIADSFWEPVGKLGHALYAAKDTGREAMQKLLNKTVNAINGTAA